MTKKIVHTNVSKRSFTTGGTEYKSEMLDEDGVVGRGKSGGVFFKGSELEAKKAAIEDMQRKRAKRN